MILRGAQLSGPAVLVRGLCRRDVCDGDGAARDVGPVCGLNGPPLTGDGTPRSRWVDFEVLVFKMVFNEKFGTDHLRQVVKDGY